MIPEREREALMRLTMCARGECPMCKYEEQCDNWDFRMELATKNMNILADALRKTENSSENPNNCEHITEDGVTCAKYPACDDCLDNPLNKVKGSERLVKGSEIPNNCKELNAYRKCVESRSFWDNKHCDGCYFGERCPFDEPKDEPQTDE